MQYTLKYLIIYCKIHKAFTMATKISLVQIQFPLAKSMLFILLKYHFLWFPEFNCL